MLASMTPTAFLRLLQLPPASRVIVARSIRGFSVLKRPPQAYDSHVALTNIERGTLAIGAAVMSFMNPRRGDLVATLGETSATPYFIYRLRDTMLLSPTGRRILQDRPRITSQTVSLSSLRGLPRNSLGRAYASWLDAEGVTPDTRDNVKYIDNEECAYVMQRYRECHDFYHTITGLPVMVEGEIALKAFEFANTLLPMTGLSMFAVTRLKRAERGRFWQTYLPWAINNGQWCSDIINVYWEELLERDVDDLRDELGIEKPPDLRRTRKHLADQRKASREKRDRLGGLRVN